MKLKKTDTGYVFDCPPEAVDELLAKEGHPYEKADAADVRAAQAEPVAPTKPRKRKAK